jgi:hypothetical protein
MPNRAQTRALTTDPAQDASSALADALDRLGRVRASGETLEALGAVYACLVTALAALDGINPSEVSQ